MGPGWTAAKGTRAGGFDGDQPHPAIGFQGDKDNGCLASSTAILKKKKLLRRAAHHFLV
jgi:hypothetical protein